MVAPAELVVSGAGTASLNGVWKRDWERERGERSIGKPQWRKAGGAIWWNGSGYWSIAGHYKHPSATAVPPRTGWKVNYCSF